jgi:glycosyltransferase involved in cell wall biosynthesis
MKIAIVIPVLNDWASLRVLLPQISTELHKTNASASVIVVDDGSTQPAGVAPALPLQNLDCQIVRLGSNMGHQRAIVVGLAHVHKHHADVDSVVVMDGDGEDRPEDVTKLLAAAERHPDTIISGRRTRRSEGPAFKLLYLGYKILHRVLTGKSVQGGNFSLIPGSRLEAILHANQVWQHYAAGILASRLPVEAIDTYRGNRIDGNSRMNFVGLIVHGLTAISVFDRVAFVRLFVACAVGMGFATIGIVAAIVFRAASPEAPAWIPYTIGFLGVLLIQLSTLSALIVGMLLQTRNATPFLPAIDALRFIVGTTPWKK